jgi:hypothetical protein
MSLTQLAVILTGIYLIIVSQEAVSSTLTLIWGIVIVVLVLLDLAPARARWRGVP